MNDNDVHGKIWDLLQKETKVDGPHGWIQWKGTNVCMDTHCKCGYHGHLDDDFCYYYQCPKCNTIYAIGSHVKFVELNDAEMKEYTLKHGCLKKDDPDKDYYMNIAGCVK